MDSSFLLVLPPRMALNQPDFLSRPAHSGDLDGSASRGTQQLHTSTGSFAQIVQFSEPELAGLEVRPGLAEEGRHEDIPATASRTSAAS